MDFIKVTKVDDVTLHKRGHSIKGTLHLTTHHLIFTLPPSPLSAQQQQQQQASRELWICYPIIDKIDFNKGSAMLALPHTTQAEVNSINSLMHGGSLRIRCRDFNYLAFDFKDLKECGDVYESIMKLTCVSSLKQLYAFYYKPILIEAQFNSWTDYDILKEFTRQGLVFEGTEGELGSDQWRITELNKEYKLCATYPSELIIPKSISDNNLLHTVKYRSKNRFPTLTYYYKKNGCTITRCSQPLVGIKQNRSYQDERLINEIFKTNHHEKKLNMIVDARPIKNAVAQHAIGGGTENIDNYRNVKKVFLNIENIHAMRESINKVKESLKDSDISSDMVNKELLNKSNWLGHIRNMLKQTELLVKSIELNSMHLVIHCSDGWDRTSQIVALVEMCLDPYYRTIEGFIVLIEKDFSSFGHKYNERLGHLVNESSFNNNTVNGNGNNILTLIKDNMLKDDLESPVVQQFLECVYQLVRQNPGAFGFNERFLRRLVYHLYACQYGTFLADSQQERAEGGAGGVVMATRSVWDYFKSRAGEFGCEQHECGTVYPNYMDVAWWFQLLGRGVAQVAQVAE